MSITIGTCRVAIGRILAMVGVAAAGAGLASAAPSQVFAHQFLQDMAPGPDLGMVYSQEQQLMVKLGTADPVYDSSQPGSFKVAGTSAVTQGRGPYGKGPHHDSD